MKKAFSLVLFAGLAGCVTLHQRPYHLTAAPGAEKSSVVIARTLTAQGQEVGTIDEEMGVVRTKWRDTPQGCVLGQNDFGKVVQRYVVVVVPSADKQDVTLRADWKCCPAGGFTSGELELRPICMGMEHFFDSQQVDLDALGAQLVAALGGTPSPQAAPVPEK